jgi:hypothetical protein
MTTAEPNPQLRAYASLAREYRDLIERAVAMGEAGYTNWQMPPSGAAVPGGLLGRDTFYNRCLDLLPRLYADSRALPDSDDDTEISLEKEECPMKPLAALLGDDDAYQSVFDPHDREPACERYMSMDLAEIYEDIAYGLERFDARHFAQAEWEWRFGMQTHTGWHILQVLPALHGLAERLG